jgi:hypothetical protein
VVGSDFDAPLHPGRIEAGMEVRIADDIRFTAGLLGMNDAARFLE